MLSFNNLSLLIYRNVQSKHQCGLGKTMIMTENAWEESTESQNNRDLMASCSITLDGSLTQGLERAKALRSKLRLPRGIESATCVWWPLNPLARRYTLISCSGRVSRWNKTRELKKGNSHKSESEQGKEQVDINLLHIYIVCVDANKSERVLILNLQMA